MGKRRLLGPRCPSGADRVLDTQDMKCHGDVPFRMVTLMTCSLLTTEPSWKWTPGPPSAEPMALVAFPR